LNPARQRYPTGGTSSKQNNPGQIFMEIGFEKGGIKE